MTLTCHHEVCQTNLPFVQPLIIVIRIDFFSYIYITTETMFGSAVMTKMLHMFKQPWIEYERRYDLTWKWVQSLKQTFRCNNITTLCLLSLSAHKCLLLQKERGALSSSKGSSFFLPLHWINSCLRVTTITQVLSSFCGEMLLSRHTQLNHTLSTLKTTIAAYKALYIK